MGRHSTVIESKIPSPPISPSRKRKREHDSAVEIEVDVSAPEPPSKKALRKAKKTKTPAKSTELQSEEKVEHATGELDTDGSIAPTSTSKRSEYGIWIGNLPWSATKLDIRTFLTKDTSIADDIITRLHMPPPSKTAVASSRQKVKPQNQGFAYIDFTSEEALAEALTLSEKLLTGRRVLIKNSKSYEGRPDKSEQQHRSAAPAGKPPSKRIFVGNLGFDTTKEALQEHFKRCGQLEDVHVATFEDTGKCKGYAWVEFVELDAAEAAIRGWVDFDQSEESKHDTIETSDGSAEEHTPKKKPKTRKWWVNRISGRPLRMEYAEGKDVRYKKRFGKERNSAKGESPQDLDHGSPEQAIKNNVDTPVAAESRPAKKFPRKVDARSIKPGAALAAAPRLTGGIVESQGRKTTFA